MDKSETYIKTCEKAEEIQAIWKKTEGLMEYAVYIPPKPEPIKDWMEEAWTDWMPCYTNSDYNYHELNPSPQAIWLPTQSQLQEMVAEHLWGDEMPINAISALLQKFYWWLDDTLPKFTTMEQLWLAFVMKERFGKIWSGTEWVKE